MKTLLSKNQENPSNQISHAWAPLKAYADLRNMKMASIYLIYYPVKVCGGLKSNEGRGGGVLRRKILAVKCNSF
jgi:hypothetical protein